ncbi:uncharacterized protein [Typha latifolia]|uniref:uncharacterized protein n=1 Tax=Typha latifolia TaxID=4733 RepID=UPI003C2EA37B
MSLSKPFFSSNLKLFLRPSSLLPRLLSFSTPESAAAARLHRRRHVQPPLSSQPKNPNSPKLPDPVSSLSGARLVLHNRILTLIRSDDLDEASLFVRHSIYSNCRPTIFTCNTVLAALLRRRRLSDLFALHRFLTQAAVAPTILTHNLLLQAHLERGTTDAALEHYRLLVNDDSILTPSPSTYRILAKGLVDNGKLQEALDLKDDMISKGFVAPDPKVYDFLMGGFVAANDPENVIALFEELKEKLGGEEVLDGSVYGNLMKGYFLKGMEKEAMECFHQVFDEMSKVRFGAVSYNSVLDALGQNSKLEEAIRLFERMKGEHNPPQRIAVDLGSFNAMVDAYCFAGRFEDAIVTFRRMSEKKCSPDAASYNNLIEHLGKNRLIGEVEEMYREMGEKEVHPDELTYVLLMEACFAVDRVDDAISYFNKMAELGLRPNAIAYEKVIRGLVNTRMIDVAQGFFDQMPEKEVKPNVVSYEMLLKAYIDIGRLENAIKIAKGILLIESAAFSGEMKELLEETLRKEGRESDMEKLYEDVEREQAEAAARAAEEKARKEALVREEKERRKAEAAAKEAAAARASAAAIEAVLGQRKKMEREESLAGGGTSAFDGGLLKRLGIDSRSAEENKVEENRSSSNNNNNSNSMGLTI